MYAIITTGGKQYRVSKGDFLQVEKLDSDEGKEINFDKVLLVGGNEKIEVGTPYLAKANVVAKVVEQTKGKKISVYKYKRRKGYDKKTGHRQKLTTIEITAISS
jgi:large subunit ribosomal protein L21